MQRNERLRTSKAQQEAEEDARRAHPELVAIVYKRFRDGISKVFATAHRDSRFPVFAAKADPVYATLLGGMRDEELARGLVEQGMVYQTMATQSRFWLEDSIIALLMRRAEETADPRLRPRIYSLDMLRSGWYESGRSLWSVGEDWREQLHMRGSWTQHIGVNALATVDEVVAEQEAEFDETKAKREAIRGLSMNDDAAAFSRVHMALGGAHRATSLKCNLLIIDPEDAPSGGLVRAIRYINPSTLTGATVREERVNLLRLSAWVHQEKLCRKPASIEVVAADLIPRFLNDGTGRAQAYFSPFSRWRDDDLWQSLGVPFAAVKAGIRDAGLDAAAWLRGDVPRWPQVRV